MMKQRAFDKKILFFVVCSLFLASCVGLGGAGSAEPRARLSAVQAATAHTQSMRPNGGITPATSTPRMAGISAFS
jgi:hypothetical protein